MHNWFLLAKTTPDNETRTTNVRPYESSFIPTANKKMKNGRAINAAAFTTAIHRWRCEPELIFYIGMPSNYSSIHSNVSLSAAFHHQWWTHSHWLWSVMMIMETFASDEFIWRKTNHTLSCHHHDLYLYLTWRGALVSSLLLFLDDNVRRYFANSYVILSSTNYHDIRFNIVAVYDPVNATPCS